MKLNLTLLAFVMLSVSAFAQVGIGTTDPDPSAILELESDNQGMLTPRMSTSDRTSILNPADGLLVFDNDLNAFYFYSSSGWNVLESDLKRDNYKLVKSVADLANELAAGGGSQYLLSSNFLYEINGTILVDFPIILNGAYVKGEDSVDDRLVNISGSALFTGSTGGNLKRMTIVGNGSPIFNITGSGTENIISLAVNYVNASSVGTLSNLNLVFINTGQFIGNVTGITATDVTSYFMTLFTWTSTNTGTFLNLNGTFDEIQLSNSRVRTDSGEIGIDVSSNPIISGSASVAQVSFDGAGNSIVGYTVGSYPNFNFDKSWYVEAQGIPRETDGTSSANFFYNGNLTTGFTQTISNGTAVEVQGSGTFITNSLFRFTASGGNNRLTYAGNKQREFTVNVSMSVRVTNASGDFYAFVIAKNGTVVTESNSVVYIDNDTQIQNIALNANVSLDNGDFVEVYVQRLTGTGSDTLAVFSENLSIR